MWLFYHDKKEFKKWNEAFTKNIRQVLIMEDLLENLENTGKPKKTGILNLPTANILHFAVRMSVRPFFCVNVIFIQKGGLNHAYCFVVSLYHRYPPMSSNIHQYIISFNSCMMFVIPDAQIRPVCILIVTYIIISYHSSEFVTSMFWGVLGVCLPIRV